MRIFVTGASSGIGRSLVIHLVGEGHEVWGVGRRKRELAGLDEILNNPRFRYEECDITDDDANRRVCQQMLEAKFTPDALVLNAAVDLEDEMPGLDSQQSRQMMRTNYDGAFFWVSAFIEPFLRRGAGQVVAVSSIFAGWPDARSVSYSASKAALSMLFRGLRMRYRGKGIDFKLINLGPVDTPINPRFEEGGEQNSRLVASSEDTARYITRSLDRNRSDYYFPFYIGCVMVLLGWLPDRLFEILTAPFKR